MIRLKKLSNTLIRSLIPRDAMRLTKKINRLLDIYIYLIYNQLGKRKEDVFISPDCHSNRLKALNLKYN